MTSKARGTGYLLRQEESTNLTLEYTYSSRLRDCAQRDNSLMGKSRLEFSTNPWSPHASPGYPAFTNPVLWATES